MKCRLDSCKRQVFNPDIENGISIKLNLDNKNCYFCCEEHANIYVSAWKQMKEENKWLDTITTYVKKIMGYEEGQLLPKRFYSRIKDLKNGTIRNVGYVNRNGENMGYPYEVIYATFVVQEQNIINAINRILFDNEAKKYNYVFSIIENNINTIYENYKLNKIIEKRQEKTLENQNIEIDVINNSEPVEARKQKDISKFLTDIDY